MLRWAATVVALSALGLHWLLAEGAINAKTGVATADAAVLCKVASGLRLASLTNDREVQRAWQQVAGLTRTAREASKLQAATSTWKEARTAKSSAAEPLAAISNKLAQALGTASRLTRNSQLFNGLANDVAGKVEQWVDTLASLTTKLQNGGRYCLAGSVEGTVVSRPVVINKGLIAKDEETAKGHEPIPTACLDTSPSALAEKPAPYEDDLNGNEEPKLDTRDVKDLFEESTKKAVVAAISISDAAAAGPEAECPLTALAARDQAGIYRATLWASIWDISTTDGSSLKGTLKAKVISKLKELATQINTHSDINATSTGHCTWQTACTWHEVSLCDAKESTLAKTITDNGQAKGVLTKTHAASGAQTQEQTEAQETHTNTEELGNAVAEDNAQKKDSITTNTQDARTAQKATKAKRGTRRTTRISAAISATAATSIR
ncbi:hypothetical protein ERJ75_000338000 [Trypanosoma vivax]|nr:hypothetical protein ERJ75_000338000 [Trypanosoma vivax]